MRKIIVNGKFLTQKITGVQRYAHEILSELDKLIDKSIYIEILAPKGELLNSSFKNIKIIQKGIFKGNLWEQISLPFYVLKNKAVCLSLCNMTSILTPHIVVVHDISFKVNPSFFSKTFSFWYRFVFFLSMKRIKNIITVSEFSKNEIIKYYKIKENKISVIYNSWQHYIKIAQDKKTLKKYGLTKNEYYFAMSSIAPNKNLKLLIEIAKINNNSIFAVAGNLNTKVFGDNLTCELPGNFKNLGYVSDEEAKELLSSCKAFLFPSFYEGFGIPPLEALSVGAKAVVSNASCLPEIYDKSVFYIDPYNYNTNIDELLENKIELPNKVLNKYSWEKSSSKLYDIIKNQYREENAYKNDI